MWKVIPCTAIAVNKMYIFQLFSFAPKKSKIATDYDWARSVGCCRRPFSAPRWTRWKRWAGWSRSPSSILTRLTRRPCPERKATQYNTLASMRLSSGWRYDLLFFSRPLYVFRSSEQNMKKFRMEIDFAWWSSRLLLFYLHWGSEIWTIQNADFWLVKTIFYKL